MLFASDYLHFDALFVGEAGHDGQIYPGTVTTLKERTDIPESAKRKMMPDNSMKYYNFKEARLGEIGDASTRDEPDKARNGAMPGTISARLYVSLRSLAGSELDVGPLLLQRGGNSPVIVSPSPVHCLQ